MPARNKPLDLQVSRGMGARFVVQFPAGFNLSAARAVIRINASTGAAFWEADQSLSFIAIDDSTDQISFTIKSDSIDLFGTRYDDIATVGDHDFRIDLTGSGTEAEPDWRLQGNWGVDAREGEQGDCQPGTVNVRFDDLTIQLRFTGALQITDVGGGGLDAVVEDPNPVMGGDFKTAGFAIIVGPDTVIEQGRIKDDTDAIRLIGTNTTAGAVKISQDNISGIDASILLDFTGLIQFMGAVPAQFDQKVVFGGLGIELNQGPIILDNAGDVGELRAGTATDVTLTAFAGNTVTLESDNQIRLDGQVRIDDVGLMRKSGADLEIIGIGGAAIFVNGGTLIKLPTVAGTVGQVATLTDGSGTLAYQDIPSGDVIDDPTPDLGGDLHTSGFRILVTTAADAARGSLDDVGTGVELRGTNTAGSVTLAQDRVSGTLASVVLGSDGITSFNGVQASFAEKVFFGALGAELNQGALVLDNAGNVGEIRAGTSSDVTITAFGSNTITLETDGQINLNEQTFVDGIGTLRNDGVNFAIESSAALVFSGGATHKWPTTAGTIGDVIKLTSVGVLSFQPAPASGLGALIDDPNPALGFPLLTNDQAINFTDDAIPTTIRGSITSTATDVKLTSADKLLFETDKVYTWPSIDGTVGQVIQTDGNGVLTFVDQGAGLTELKDDTAPRLGGDLFSEAFSISIGTLASPIGRIRNSAGNFAVERQGAASLILDGGSPMTWPSGVGTPGQVLTTDGVNTLSYTSASVGLTDIEFDLSPQLGANLDTNNFAILIDDVGQLSKIGGNFRIQSQGAGVLELEGGVDALVWPANDATLAGQSLVSNAAKALSFATRLASVAEDTTPNLGGILTTSGNSVIWSDDDVPTNSFGIITGTAAAFTINALQATDLVLDAGEPLKWPTADGTPNQLMLTDGAGKLSFGSSTGIGSVVEDPAPDLGGDLATLGNSILVGGTRAVPIGFIRQSGLDFELARNGAARLILNGGAPTTWPTDSGALGEVLTAQGDGTVEFDAPVTGGISEVFDDKTPVLGGLLNTAFPILIADVGQLSKIGADFVIESQGAGKLLLEGGITALQWPPDDGLVDQCLITNGSAALSFATRLAALNEDATPELAGNLDLGGFVVDEAAEGSLGFISSVWTFGGLNTAGTTEITQATATTPAKITLSGSVNRITLDAGRVDHLGDTRFLSELALDFGGFVEAKIQATGVNAAALTGEAGTTVSVLSDTALKLKGGTQEFSWPLSDTGNDGDVVTTDGVGVLRIASPSSVLVKNPGIINVLDPPDGFGFTKMKNTLSPANALINDTAIAFYIANATVPLMFPRGDYPFSVSITAPQGKVAPPVFFAPSQAVQHLTSGQNFAATYFHWFGDRIGDANPVPFFEQHAEGGFGLEGICLIGQPGDPDIFDPRCACGIRISRKDPGSIVNSGKADYPFLGLQQFDCGIIGGDLEEGQFGADNMRFGTVNFKDCRIGLMLLGEQQIGWYFDNFRYSASGSDPNQITEVAVNILGGGQLNIHAGKILANDIVLLRISPVTGSIGDNNALYRFGTLGQDANAGSLVLLDDRSEENGVGGQHKVIFDNFRHIGFGSPAGPNFARISGFGQLVMNGQFQAGQLHDGLFLEGKSDTERAKAVFSACDCNFTPEMVAGTLDRVFTGSGFFSLAEVLGMSNLEVREPFNSSTSGNGVGDLGPTGAARTAWNALAPVAKYSGSGPLGDTVDLTR